MEKVRPWCGRPSDRRRLKNRTEQYSRATEIRVFAVVGSSFSEAKRETVIVIVVCDLTFYCLRVFSIHFFSDVGESKLFYMTCLYSCSRKLLDRFPGSVCHKGVTKTADLTIKRHYSDTSTSSSPSITLTLKGI